MGLNMVSFDDDFPEHQDRDSGSNLDGFDFEKVIKAWQSTIDILREYNTEFVHIVADHPGLTPDDRSFILEGLLAHGESELTDAEVILAQNPSRMSVSNFLTISHKVGSAKVVLLMKGADLEMFEVARYLSLGSAFSRLHRAEAFYRCMRQIRKLRDGDGWPIYGDHADTELFENMLRKTAAVRLVDVERFDPATPEEIPCAICQETEIKSIITWCRSMLLPCCEAPVHGCCMAMRLRNGHQDCPRCRFLFSEEDMAAMIHERTFQLEEGLRTPCYEDCERMQSIV